MSGQQKYKRSEAEFITPAGIGTFLTVLPGHAKKSAKEDSLAYKLELWVPNISVQPVPGDDGSLYRSVATVAYHDCPDQANWQDYVWGREIAPGVRSDKGTFHKLEQIEGRRLSLGKYPKAQDRYVLTISNVLYPKAFSLDSAQLTDPAIKKQFEEGVASRAPRILKWCNPQNPSELERVVARSNAERMAGKAPIAEDKYHQTLIPVLPGEFWPGCWFQVTGHVYWSSFLKRPLLALGDILLVRQDERLTMESSPDESFAPFAPPAELAPPAFAPPSALPPFMQAPAAPPPPFKPAAPSTGWAI